VFPMVDVVNVKARKLTSEPRNNDSKPPKSFE